MSKKTVFRELIKNNATERINISQLLSEKLKFSNILTSIEFTSFEFSVGKVEDYIGIIFAILDIGLAKIRFNVWDERRLGIDFITVKYNSILELDAKQIIENFETPISKIEFYGSTLAGERVDFYLDPNHYLNMEIAIRETTGSETETLRLKMEGLKDFINEIM